MEFETTLDLYLAMQNAYSVSAEAVKVAEKAFYGALGMSDFVESEFYDYCVAEDLF